LLALPTGDDGAADGDYLLEVVAADDPAGAAGLLQAEAERQLGVAPSRALEIAELIDRIAVAGGVPSDPSGSLGCPGDRPELPALAARLRATALRNLGLYGKALAEFERAGGLYRALGDEVGWAQTRTGAAQTRCYMGELGPALHEAERAREILATAGAWQALARHESALGQLFLELGRTQDALDAYDRALEATHRAPTQEERDLVEAEVRIGQANVYTRLDDYARAAALLRGSAAAFRRYGRPSAAAVAEGYRARALAAQGHLSRALALATAVRATLRELGMAARAAIFGQVAIDCLLELNRPREAIQLANAVTAELDANDAGIELAKTLLQRALAHQRLADLSAAAADLTWAAELFRAGGCAGWAAVVRLQRAEVLERAGALTDALGEAVAAGRELRRGQQVVPGARADLVRASVLRRLGDLESSVVAARAARVVARRQRVPLLEYRAWRLLGELAQADGRADDALRAFGRAVAALEEGQGRVLAEQRATFLEGKLEVYEEMVRLCLEAGDAPTAFAFAERAKARSLLDALALRTPAMPMRDVSGPARALADELATLRRRSDRLSSALFDPRPQDDLGTTSLAGGQAQAGLRAELEQCEARVAAVVEQLRLSGAADLERLALLQGRVYSPLKHLGPRTALVEYMAVGEDIAIFVARRGQRLGAVWAPGPAAARQVQRLRAALELNLDAALAARGDLARLGALEHQARAVLRRLHALILEPVGRLLDGVERLVLVPHGVLRGFPFPALHDGRRYLVESHEIVLEHSASTITFCRRPPRPSPSLRTLVVARSEDGLMPHVLAEGRAVAALFPGAQLFEDAATVAGVREHARSADVVHVAAHGRQRSDSPLFSHVRLADGNLTTLDFLDLELDCQLVTLSACESGLGPVVAGDDQVGLTRSLLYAGARSVLQSLWHVEDRATSQLMVRFYERLRAGDGRARALRAAQRLMLADEREPGHRHPLFWAPFTLVGDWGPLVSASGSRARRRRPGTRPRPGD
jgi:CHAT domain-containing protein